jgi:hypothetical protein
MEIVQLINDPKPAAVLTVEAGWMGKILCHVLI